MGQSYQEKLGRDYSGLWEERKQVGEQGGTQQTPKLRRQLESTESTEGLDCDPQSSSPAGPQTVTMFGDTARKEVIWVN